MRIAKWSKDSFKMLPVTPYPSAISVYRIIESYRVIILHTHALTHTRTHTHTHSHTHTLSQRGGEVKSKFLCACVREWKKNKMSAVFTTFFLLGLLIGSACLLAFWPSFSLGFPVKSSAPNEMAGNFFHQVWMHLRFDLCFTS